jgi:hypothetical protein
LSALTSGFAQAATSTPPPPACPNAQQYLDAGAACARATRASDVDSEVTSCRAAVLQAGQCASAETGLAKIDDVGNEASFALTTGMAVYKQSNGTAVDDATGWLRVAMALYRTLRDDTTAPEDVRAAASKDMNVILQTTWYADGPPPSSPPGNPASPPGGIPLL